MSDWLDELSPDERSQWDEFVEHFRRDAVEKIGGSDLFVSLVPERGWDVKFATELGAAIMLDKPVMAVVPPGTEISGKLRAVADRIVEADIDTEDGRERIAAELRDWRPA